MKQNNCSQEEAVLKAVQSGKWDETTRSHFTSCQICQEQAHVVGWMQGLDKETPTELHPVPSYQRTWLKAQFLEERQTYKNALRPLRVFQAVLQALIALMLVSTVIWQWPFLQNWLMDLLSGMNEISIETRDFGMNHIFLVGFFVFLVFTIFVSYCNSSPIF